MDDEPVNSSEDSNMNTLVNIQEQEPQFERFERFTALENGNYWRALVDGHEEHVTAGQVLMIYKIDYVDQSPHTIHMLLHPSQLEYSTRVVKYLVEDFVSKFEFVETSEAEAIRAAEIREIQGQLQDSQDELTRAFTDANLMDALIEKELPKEETEAAGGLPVRLETFDADVVAAVKTQKLSTLMSRGLTETGIQQIRAGLNNQKDIAQRRGQWIEKRTQRLSKIASRMTPFFKEKAELAKAVSREMMDHVDELMKGIGNLNLYVLKDVFIDTLQEGASAPEDEKLSITQKVLFMDEEMAVWTDVDDDYDCQNREGFFKALCDHPELVDQIFPSKRCIVNVATTRQDHNYSRRGYTWQEAERLRKENQRQFLLVRDGENIHVVLSPELFHNFCATLFPTKNEVDAPFKGVDGQNITYRDLDYTKSLERFEATALGYKRLLILLCGLDHNKQLFGPFYKGEPSLDFVSMKFQEENFNFIHDVDGEGLLAGERPPSVTEWVKELNSRICAGSRVLVQWRRVFNTDTISSAYERENIHNYGSDSRRALMYTPDCADDLGLIEGIVKRKQNNLVIDVSVSGDSRQYKWRTFNAQLNLSMALRGADPFDIVCLDTLDPEDAHWYLHDRQSRRMNVTGIRMLKSAIRRAERERKTEQPVRDELLKSLEASGLSSDRGSMLRYVNQAIAKWRCAHPTIEPQDLLQNRKKLNAVADQVFFLAGLGRNPKNEIAESESLIGRSVLRITLSASGKYVAYSTALPAERDDRLIPFYWVVKTTYILNKKGVKAGHQSFVLLRKHNPAETLVFEAESVEEYIQEGLVPFKTPKAKAEALEDVADITIDQILAAKGNPDKTIALLNEYIKCRYDQTMKSTGKYVVEPFVSLALGDAILKDTDFNSRALYQRHTLFGFTGKTGHVIAWLCAGIKELEAEFLSEYVSIYIEKSVAHKTASGWLTQFSGKELQEVLEFSFYEPDPFSDWCGENNLYKKIPAVEGYRYSFSKRLETVAGGDSVIAIDLNRTGGKTLDEFLGISKPENFCPCYVYEADGFGETKIDIFQMTSETSNLFKRYSVNSFDTLAEALGSFRNPKKYISKVDKKSYSVEVEAVEVDPRVLNGVKAIQSFDYTEISRVELP